VQRQCSDPGTRKLAWVADSLTYGASCRVYATFPAIAKLARTEVTQMKKKLHHSSHIRLIRVCSKYT